MKQAVQEAVSLRDRTRDDFFRAKLIRPTTPYTPIKCFGRDIREMWARRAAALFSVCGRKQPSA